MSRRAALRRLAVVGLGALPRLRRAAQSPPTATLRVFRATGRGSPLRGTRKDAEIRFPRTLAFPCSSVSAARPLPRPGGTQAEGASRRDGADRGVSLKVMRRSAAMNRASDCRPARLQWSRASAMPPSPAEERLNGAKPKRNVSVAFLSTTESAETHLCAARKGLGKGASRISAANCS